MRGAAMFAAACLLTACGAEPPADAPSEPDAAGPRAVAAGAAPTSQAGVPMLNRVKLASPLRLTGTEPFWGADLGGGRLVLQRPDQPDVALAATGPVLQGERAVWRAPSTVVTLTSGPCSDGMSDRIYPLTAEVRSGAVIWKGCAANAAAFARAGEAGEVR